jgi:hypothetical protein
LKKKTTEKIKKYLPLFEVISEMWRWDRPQTAPNKIPAAVKIQKKLYKRIKNFS